MTERTKRRLIVVMIPVVCILLDQLSKQFARQTLYGAPARLAAAGMLRIEYTENPGAFLSLGANLPDELRFVVFTLFVVALLIGLAVFAWRMSDDTPMAVVVAIALVIGGGVSNLIDRLANDGRVVDFMQLNAGPLHTGVFNVADVAIMGGLALMLVSLFLEGRRSSGETREMQETKEMRETEVD